MGNKVNKSILLTGACGFVGHHLTKKLLEQNYKVVALDQNADPLDVEGLKITNVNLLEPCSLSSLPKRWFYVIHLAAISVPGLFTQTSQVISNLQMTMNLLEHIEEARVLLVSSCHVYEPGNVPRREDDIIRPQGRYGLSKHLCEQLLPHYLNKLDIRIARPFNHIGPGMRNELMIPSLLKKLSLSSKDLNSPIIMHGRNSIRDFIDVRDVVSAYMSILNLENPKKRIFNVCTGKGSSVEDVAKEALKILDLPNPVVFENKNVSEDDIQFIVGDPTRLHESTGWKSCYSLTDSLKSLIQFNRTGEN